MLRPVLLAIQRLLGRSDLQEDNLRRLLDRLAPEELKGVLLGDYLVGRPVGRGGYATVHLGTQLSTGRKVAVKILNDGMPEYSRARFQQEAVFLSRLNHPHVIGILGYGEDAWDGRADRMVRAGGGRPVGGPRGRPSAPRPQARQPDGQRGRRGQTDGLWRGPQPR
jgi:hypothetical protein